MGVGAIAKPAFVTTQFGILELTPAGCSDGILFTVAAALVGMAAGRLISAAVDRSIDRAPLGYFVLEVVVAVMLLAVACCRESEAAGT